MSLKTFKPSFSGGEISPEMFGRIDDGKFQSGAASIENMIATALGPAEKRPGFEFVKATKANGQARLIPFTYSTDQTYVIEMGVGYFRFHTQGATLIPPAIGSLPVFKPCLAATFTIASPAVVSMAAHGLNASDPVVFTITTAGNFPTGIVSATVYYVNVIDANTFHISATPGGANINTSGTQSGSFLGEYSYAQGALVSFAGSIYYLGVSLAIVTDPSVAFGQWFVVPVDAYEIPNPYSPGDLMSIHYVQSADVMTLVHPNYPPLELRRVSATMWTLVGIVFGQALSPPTGVAVSASPGYLAKISTITLANPALITTITNHTLALGDGIYIKGLTATIGGVPTVLDGFYLVNNVPIVSGALVPNELTVMDYNGNILDSSGWSSFAAGATIQFGSKIFDITNFYVVTAVAADGIQQSAVSAEVSVLNNLNVTGSFNTITWAASPTAFRYYIYKKRNGLYGYIGTTLASALSFGDNNIAVDLSITPPLFDPVFATAGNYPGAVSYFQQRRCFGGTQAQPQNFWMTKSGTESDMSYSLPIVDTDRIAIGIAVRERSTIEHIVPLLQLVLLTSATEISVSPTNTDVITPSSIDPRPQSYIGASQVQPTIVNNSLIYAAARGGHIREMGYQWQIGGFVTGDISLRAAHLFDNFTITDQAFMKCPWQAVWFVSSNGQLLGLTYTPEQQIGAWHHHTTDGTFVSIACVAEGAEDRLYAVINRVVNGATVAYVERMRTRNFNALIKDCFFVDAGGTFDGTNLGGSLASATEHPSDGTWNLAATGPIFVFPAQTDVGSFLVLTGSDGIQYNFNVRSTSSATAAIGLAVSPVPAGVTFAPTTIWAWARPTISGLTWLEGKTVKILGDGAVQPPQVVTGGAVTIQHPCTLVTIGLPYSPTIKSLPLVAQVDAMGQGRTKNINKCWVRLNLSSSVFAGPSQGSLVEFKQRTSEAFGNPPDPVTDEIEITIPASWTTSGQIYITQTDPLPLTVVGLTLEAAIGG